MKNRRSIIVLIVLLAVGFAAVSTTLVINGVIGLSFGELDVYYSKAVINGVEDNSVIKDKTHIEFDTTMTLVGEKYKLDYDVTNGSKNYDAEISMNCDYETEDGGEYLSLDNKINTDDLLEAMTTRTGHLTIKMIKAVTEPKDIHITCEIVATPRERDKDPGDVITKEPVTLVETILSKANDASIQEYTSGDKGEVYAFNHDETEQMGANTDYRYIGNVPNNYITYNDELWRVIGVFEDENGVKRAKIIKDTTLDYYSFGQTSNFSSSTIKSVLEDYPNDEAYSQLDKVNYYLGSSSAPNLSADTYYANERSKTIPSGNSYVYKGKVGLLYVSDYYYTYGLGVNDACYNDSNSCTSGNLLASPSSSWMFGDKYFWTMDVNSSNSVFYITSYGQLYISGTTSREQVLPVAYLNADIIHSDGDGTQEHPYVIKSASNDKPESNYDGGNLVNLVLSKKNSDDASYGRETKKEVFAFNHDVTSQESSTKSYRFIGNKPNNYVMYDNEVYRIIGIFEDENGVKRAKIVKDKYDEYNGAYYFNSSVPWQREYNSDYIVTEDVFENDYATSYINRILNRRISDGNLALADNVDWYLGGFNSSTESANDFYQSERGNSVYPGNNKKWNGKVGLMYVSDFLYTYANGVDDMCFNHKTCYASGNRGEMSSSWLYNGYQEWVINTSSENNNIAANMNAYSSLFAEKGILSSPTWSNSANIRPTLYLKSEVESLEGDGSKEHPYTLASYDSRDFVSTLTPPSDVTSKSNIETLTFINGEPKAPDNAIKSWDASYAKNSSIIGYILDDDNDGVYELYFVKKGKIYTNYSTDGLFSFSELTNINGMENFSTKNIYYMSNMFKSTLKLGSLDLSHFDTGLTESMSQMFDMCGVSSIDVSNFDTSYLTSMYGMFMQMPNIREIDVSMLNTPRLTNMHETFSSAGYWDKNVLETVKLGNINTSKVKYMDYLFDNCTKLKNVDVANLDFSAGPDISGMFSSCYELEHLDVETFDITGAIKANGLFSNSYKLNTKIKITSPTVTSYRQMFTKTATEDGAQITVDYSSDTSSLVDNMIATKSTDSNVIKGSLLS